MKRKLFKVRSKVTGMTYDVYDVWQISKNETLYLIKNLGQWQYWDSDRFHEIDKPIVIVNVQVKVD